MRESDINAVDIKGIGLSGQMVGLVVLDKNGQVLRPCILWDDQRSVRETEELTAQIGLETILHETSNPLFATFIAPKLVWMRRHEPDKYSKIANVLMPKDYIAYRLTGHIGTEVSDASGTCLFNVRNRGWSKVMIKAMEIDEDWLPECTESDEIIGSITKIAATESGFSAGTSVVAAGYFGDLPFPMNGMPLLVPAVGVEFFPEGATGFIQVCFAVPEGKSGNISFWDTSAEPVVESELPTTISNGIACATASQTGAYGLVETLAD